MAEALIQRSFAGGELAPSLLARADLAKYQTGLRRCRNFLVRRHGGVANRPGTQLVAETKTSGSSKSFLYAFEFAATGQSTILEVGDHYVRFHRHGAPVTVSGVAAWDVGADYAVGALVVHGGVHYYATAPSTGVAPPAPATWYPLSGTILELPTPFPAGVWQDPSRACVTQQGLVVTISHLNYPPHELVYLEPTHWVLRPALIGPAIGPPTAPATGTAGPAGTRTYRYQVTAAKAETYEESHPSPVIEVVSAGEPTADAPHVVTWDAVAGAVEYYVYGDASDGNGTYGYLGTATDVLEFRDTGFVPDFSLTPPIPRPLFDVPLGYPAVNTVYQQRRIFAGTDLDRETVYTSQTGYLHNFCIRSPLQDDDAVTFRLAANEIQIVTHLVNLKTLVLLTDRGIWQVRGDETGVLTPTGIQPHQQAWTGSAFVQPVVIGEAILFLEARGNLLRDLRLEQELTGYRGKDLCLYAAHLFTGHTIDRLTYAEVPDSIVWAVRTDGTLLGLTYIPDEDVWGWHRHDTQDGAFEDVCTIDEDQEDKVYVIVRRGTQRFVERFASRQYLTLEEACHVDHAVTSAAAVARRTLTGLEHFEGRTVAVVGDGVPRGRFTVRSGAVTLDAPVTTAFVGLPITAQLETLALDVTGSQVRDTRQLVSSVALLLEASVRNFTVGPSFDKLFPVRPEAWDARTLVDGRVELTVTGQFGADATVVVEHTAPTPLTVVGILPHVTLGG